MNFAELLDDKEKFVERVKSALSKKAFGKVDELKQEMSADFLKGEEK